MLKSGKVPVGVKSLLEDLATEEKLDKRLRTEILTDGDARRDLYFVSLHSSVFFESYDPAYDTNNSHRDTWRSHRSSREYAASIALDLVYYVVLPII